jgi:IS4 transposase
MNARHIALIYQKRWKIKLLFKLLKQNFPSQFLLGDNENAIKIQI